MMEDDKNIERFFKNRLESSEFSYQEKDWEALEANLDKTLPVASTRLAIYKMVLIGAVIALLAFLMGWFVRDQMSTRDRSEGVAPEGRIDNNTLPTDTYDYTGKSEATDPSSVAKAGDVQQLPAAQSDPSSFIADRKEDQKKVQYRNRERADEASLSGATPVYSEMPLASDVERKQGLLFIDSNLPDGALPYSPEEKRIIVSPKIQFKERWSVGLSLAPDLNSIGLAAKKSVTTKFGAQIFYSIADRWILSTGIFYNKKKYETDAEGYSPPEGYWYYQTNNQKPSNIIGSCGVVDVPIKVTYLFNPASRVVLGTSIGVSSYVLLDEAYDFEFDSYYSGAAEGWYTEENSSVIAGVANASLLVRLHLNKQFSLVAEPYLQMPLKDIGWGKVDLVSTGLLFTLQYQLFKPTTITK